MMVTRLSGSRKVQTCVSWGCGKSVCFSSHFRQETQGYLDRAFQGIQDLPLIQVATLANKGPELQKGGVNAGRCQGPTVMGLQRP